MRVFHKLVISSLVFSLLVAAIGQFAAVHSQRTLREAVRAGWEAVAAETMDKIDRCIQRRIEDLQVYARVQRLQEALAESNERFDRMADPLGHIHELDEKWMASPEHVLSPWMHALLDAGLSETLRKEVEIEDFYRRQYGYTLFGEVFVTNKHGANVAQTGWTSDYYQADEAWWHRARERGTYVGDIAYDESARILSLELAVAVTDARGDFAGVLKAVWNVKEIFGILARVRDASEHRSTTLDLLSDDGQVLHHVGPLAMSEGSGITKEGIVRIPDGTRAFVVHAPSRGYRDFEGLPWTLRMGYDAAEILAPAAGLQTVLLAFSAVVAAAALLGGLLLARHIARPIVALTETAKAVSQHEDYSVRAAPVSHGEMRTLVDAFNTMLGRIQQHERALIAGNEQLIAEVAERKRAEHEQKLLLDQLEARNQELKDFAYVVSHDLKAPLRGITVLAEWLDADYRDKLGDDGAEQLRLLHSRATRMHGLIDGILQYSRIGRIEDHAEPVDLNELVIEIIDAVAPPEHIKIAVQDALPTIVSSRTRMTQVFQNLISNAIKYMDKPEGRVEVGCAEEAEELTFHVSDNGPGIDVRQFENIFRIFHTLAPHDAGEGTGIGLALVKKIVEYFGGRAWVASEIGKGSTFFFTIPKEIPESRHEKLQTHVAG